MKRNLDTRTACSGIAPVGQPGLVAFRIVRMATPCSDEPDGQHAYRQPRRPPRRHALAVGHLRAVPASLLRRGLSDGVLMRRAICCDALPGARGAAARARQSKSQDGADFRPRCAGGQSVFTSTDNSRSVQSAPTHTENSPHIRASIAFDIRTLPMDHEYIAAIVDDHHPGKGTWRLLPKMDHGFALHKSLNDSVAHEFVGPFGDQALQEAVKWIREKVG